MKSSSTQDAGRRRSAGACIIARGERRQWFWRLRVAGVALCMLFAAACRQDMQDQPKYVVYRESKFFKDDLSARPLVAGTVARGWLKADTQLYTGKTGAAAAQAGSTAPPTGGGAGARGAAGGATTGGGAASGAASGGGNYPGDVDTFPFPVTEEVVKRGQERYQIFCSVCHGMTGDGDGMIVRRGYRRPPSYHTDDLRRAPVGHFFDVITNGWGAMPNYAQQIPVQDRWAIIAYVRALQLSEQGVTSNNTPVTSPGSKPATGGPR